jgi:hypothetical protein
MLVFFYFILNALIFLVYKINSNDAIKDIDIFCKSILLSSLEKFLLISLKSIMKRVKYLLHKLVHLQPTKIYGHVHFDDFEIM